jgi:hypothetical protein
MHSVEEQCAAIRAALLKSKLRSQFAVKEAVGVAEAMKRLKVKPQRFQRLVLLGDLKTFFVGQQEMVLEEQIAAFLARSSR